MKITELLINSKLLPRREIEILLSHILKQNRVYLYAHGEQLLTAKQLASFYHLSKRREQSEPIAYLIGYKEFWSLNLKVNEHTLIPRPETELIVKLVLKNFAPKTKMKVADLGTGCGAIALALAKERPNWQICAIDNSKEALKMAKKNATSLNISNVNFHHSNWGQNIPDMKFNLIVSNPPYIAANDPHLKTEIKYEPISALIAGKDGLTAIKTIISQAKNEFTTQGMLILEHGFDQGKKIRQLMTTDYNAIKTYQDLSGNDRVTIGRLNCLL